MMNAMTFSDSLNTSKSPNKSKKILFHSSILSAGDSVIRNFNIHNHGLSRYDHG